MKIFMDTKPAEKLNNPTTGDYWRDGEDNIHVAVQELGDENYEFLIAIHSLVEGKLIEEKKMKEQNNISMKNDVSKKQHEKPLIIHDDPGDDPLSLYYHEHSFATYIEMLIAKELDISWDKE